MSSIQSLSANVINDSRGDKTIEAGIVLAGDFSGTASVPSGKSKGSHEAKTVEAERAVQLIDSDIRSYLEGKTFDGQSDFDAALIAFDGTADKSAFGGNSLLALSLAFARAESKQNSNPLFAHFGQILGTETPHGHLRLYANMIEGGLHAKNNLRFQEHWIIGKGHSLKKQITEIKSFYADLGLELKKTLSLDNLPLSDEASYAPNFASEDMPFKIMSELRRRNFLDEVLDLGMDAAGSDVKADPQELFAIYQKWAKDFGLIALEDPFGEEDFSNFAKLKEQLPSVLIIGDDLTTTNRLLIEKAEESHAVNGVIIKPNQIGTVSEAMDAVRTARNFGHKIIVSHRSGETLDDWIADFAVGVGADGFKLGAPGRPERLSKYDRLLRIEQEMLG